MRIEQGPRQISHDELVSLLKERARMIDDSSTESASEKNVKLLDLASQINLQQRYYSEKQWVLLDRWAHFEIAYGAFATGTVLGGYSANDIATKEKMYVELKKELLGQWKKEFGTEGPQS